MIMTKMVAEKMPMSMSFRDHLSRTGQSIMIGMDITCYVSHISESWLDLLRTSDRRSRTQFAMKDLLLKLMDSGVMQYAVGC